MSVLLIDNYDSFTYNLVQYLKELGKHVIVHRNDEITLDEIEELKPSHIIISPGPCTPNEAGMSMQIIKQFSEKVPMLGVCLGHQCIAQTFGGDIIKAKKIMHGKTSHIQHNKKGLFHNISSPMQVTRYHSLVVDNTTLPDCLNISAWIDETENNRTIMAIQHQSLAVFGVQFHPESILTIDGKQLLKNFLTVKTS